MNNELLLLNKKHTDALIEQTKKNKTTRNTPTQTKLANGNFFLFTTNTPL